MDLLWPGCSSTPAGWFPVTGEVESNVVSLVSKQESYHSSAAPLKSPFYLPKREGEKYHLIPVHCSMEWENTSNETSAPNRPCFPLQSSASDWNPHRKLFDMPSSEGLIPSGNVCLACPLPQPPLGDRMCFQPPSSLTLFKLSVVNYSAAFQLDASQGAKPH